MSMSSCNAGRASLGAPRRITPPVNPSTNAPEGRTTIEQAPPMARKAFAVNDAVRERVRYLAGVGVPQDGIAKIIGCAPKTLRKRFRDDLDRGVAEATATVSGFLSAAAKGGSIPAIIFWLKTRGIGGRRRRQIPQFRATAGRMTRWCSSCPITTEIPS